VNVDLEGDDQAGIEDDGQPPAWAVSSQAIADARLKWRWHETDTEAPISGCLRLMYLLPDQHLQSTPRDLLPRSCCISQQASSS
jgi:hypothetical protein